MKKIILLAISIFTLYSCKSEHQKNVEAIKQSSSELQIEFSKKQNLSSIKKLETRVDSITNILTRLSNSESNKENDSLKILIDVINEQYVTCKETNMQRLVCERINGNYKGEGDLLYYLENWGYVRSGEVNTQIEIGSEGKVVFSVKSSWNPWEIVPVGLRNINFKGDSVITATMFNLETKNSISDFKWTNNNIDLSSSTFHSINHKF
jgi:hypothetical protein